MDAWWLVFWVLVAACVVVKRLDGSLVQGFKVDAGPAAAALRRRYLAVFWLVKLCDWLQGPYFYEVYASKLHDDGTPFTGVIVSSLFVTGFASSLVFGTVISAVSDSMGRRKGCLLCALFFTLSCFSVHTNALPVLYAGRLASGVASSLMHSAFESWLCTASASLAVSPELCAKWRDEVFTVQAFGDGVVAVFAGVVANYVAATYGGAVAVFNVAAVVGVVMALACASLWEENYGSGDASGVPSLGDLSAAVQVLRTDAPVLLLGLIQACFDAAMFCFVMLWVPAIKVASQVSGGSSDLPLGLLFACLMVCIMIGSSSYGLLKSAGVRTEDAAWGVTAVGAAALFAPVLSPSLVVTAGAWLVFESCVGVSFPAFGTIRAQILPGNCRSAIMAVYRVPLNLLVMGILLNSEAMGTRGSLLACCTLLVAACVLQGVLRPKLRARRLKSAKGKQ